MTNKKGRGRYKDLTGKKFGKITVVERLENNHKNQTIWLCECDCGKIEKIKGVYLTSGKESCGCTRNGVPMPNIDSSADLTNKRFGRLTALYSIPKTKNTLNWFCRCECNNECIVYSYHLQNGDTTSCGCFSKENLRKKATIHGHTQGGKHSSVYNTWLCMRERVFNKNHEHYHYYGGQGITICDKWLTFEGFYEDMGDRPKGHTIDRIDNDKSYYKENCRWANSKTQGNNKKDVRMFTYKNKTQNMSDWAKEYNLTPACFCARLNDGWDFEKALLTPIDESKQRFKK